MHVTNGNTSPSKRGKTEKWPRGFLSLFVSHISEKVDSNQLSNGRIVLTSWLAIENLDPLILGHEGYISLPLVVNSDALAIMKQKKGELGCNDELFLSKLKHRCDFLPFQVDSCLAVFKSVV